MYSVLLCLRCLSRNCDSGLPDTYQTSIYGKVSPNWVSFAERRASHFVVARSWFAETMGKSSVWKAHNTYFTNFVNAVFDTRWTTITSLTLGSSLAGNSASNVVFVFTYSIAFIYSIYCLLIAIVVLTFTYCLIKRTLSLSCIIIAKCMRRYKNADQLIPFWVVRSSRNRTT